VAYLSVTWWEVVRVLKSVVFPDFGKPRMPSCTELLPLEGPFEAAGRLSGAGP
jgi:hypothetical protein